MGGWVSGRITPRDVRLWALSDLPHMRTILVTLFGLLLVFVAAGFMLPALAKMHIQSIPSEVVMLYTLGVVLAVTGLAVVGFALAKKFRSSRT